MFETSMYDELRRVAKAVADGRTQTALATAEQLCDAARVVQQAQDLLDGVSADLAARMEQAKAHETEGSPTVASWLRRELRVPLGQARTRVAAGRTLQRLPQVADALSAGEVRLDHVHAFTAGLRKVGDQTLTDALPLLLPVARDEDPGALREAIDHLHHTVRPEDLDDAWAKGMDKRDLKLARCGDGYHVTGFLDILSGAKLHSFLKAASAGDGPDDDRKPSERRVDALGRLVDHAVHEGEPGNGIHPQVQVIAELDTLQGRVADGAAPATLAGFGAIGNDLLGYLTCTSDLTGVLTDGTQGQTPQATVLNVGRTRRLATPQQRVAVIARQDGYCANPGCTNTLLEVHHVAWWGRDGGDTDLHNLIGLCSRCHHLVHQQKLTVQPDGHGGFAFRRTTGHRIDDHTRQRRHRIRRLLRTALKEPPPAGSKPRPPRPKRQRPPTSVAEDHLTKILRKYQHPMRT